MRARRRPTRPSRSGSGWSATGRPHRRPEIRWITAAWERISAPSHTAAVRRLEHASDCSCVRVSFVRRTAAALRCSAFKSLCRAVGWAALSTAAVIGVASIKVSRMCPAGGGALLCSGLLGLSTIAAERQLPTSHRMVLTTSLWHTQSTQSTPEHAMDIAGKPQWSHACALCCRSAQWPCSPRACLPLLSFPLVCEACGGVLR